MSDPDHARDVGRSLWRNPNFRLLFGAQIISLLGSGVTTVGLALFAYQLTGGASATAVIGNALMLRILAFLLFSQPAGVIADRVSRKKILIAADLLRFGLLALFPFVSTVWQVYALIFAINAVTAFFTPTFEASIPEVVGDEQYVKALSLSRVAVDVEAVAAPAVAGLLVALLGIRWVFWFDAFTYLVSALMVVAASVPYVSKAVTPLSLRSFLSEITTGTRVLLREPSLRQALTLSFAEATAGAAAIVVTVAYVRDVLGRGETTFAVVMAGLGLGSSLAAVILGRATGRYEQGVPDRAVLHGRRHTWAARVLILGGIVLGLILLPGMFKPPLIVFALLWLLNGAGQALIAIPSSTLLAEHTVEEERGRAFAAHFALTHACWLITYPAVGHAAARWGAPATFTVAGIVCLLITAAAIALGRGAGHGAHTHDRGVHQLPEPSGRDRFTSSEELRRLLQACDKEGDRELKAFIIIASTTGLRKGSILPRKFSDVHLEEKVPYIYVGKTKNGDPIKIPLSQLAIDAIKQLPSYGRSEYLFPAKPNVRFKGNFQKPYAWDLGKRFRRICRLAQVENLRIHDLRHYATTVLIYEGHP